MWFYFSRGVFAAASNTAPGLRVTWLLGRPSHKGLLTTQRYCQEVQGGEMIPPELPTSLPAGIFLAMTLFSSFCGREFCTELPSVPRCAGTSQGRSTSTRKGLPSANFPNSGRSRDSLSPFLLLSPFRLSLQTEKTANLINKG